MKKIILLFLISLVLAATGQQIESSISGYVNSDGKSLANGKLDFYLNDGSSTHQNVYSDINLTKVVGQPIALNSAGLPTSGGVPITLFANGTYRMVIKNSSGNVLYNKSGLKYTGTVDFGGLYVDVLSTYGSTDTALTNVISAIGSTPTTLLFRPGTYTSSTPHTFPSSATLKFMQGAYLNTSVGNTTQINGYIDAGQYQIFQGAGTVVINTANNLIQPSYWSGVSGSVAINYNASMNNVSMSRLSTITASIDYLLSSSISSNLISSLTITSNKISCLTINVSSIIVSGIYANAYPFSIGVVSANWSFDGADQDLDITVPSGSAGIIVGFTITDTYGDYNYGHNNYYVGAAGYTYTVKFQSANIIRIHSHDVAGGSSAGTLANIKIAYF